MAAPGSQVQIAKPAKGGSANGVLPVSASTIKQGSPKSAGRKPTSTRVAGPRLKVVIRRLPPGLTKDELEAALGEDWKLGGGRVDWAALKPGKASQDPSKPSRPSRAYLHVTSREHLAGLSERVQQTSFQDAKNTSGSPALLGPPAVEFAPYGKVPSSKRRNDARQGTIDQDPEFISFLESLTNPVAKPSGAENQSDGASKKDEAATVTPLIKFLREKKASRGKDSAKGSKQSRAEAKAGRGEKGADKKPSGKGAKILSQDRGSKKGGKADEAAGKAVKVLNREAAVIAKRVKAGSVEAGTPTSAESKDETTAPKAPPAERKRERGNASAAARMVQRDLGLGAGGGQRSGRRKEMTDVQKGSKDSDKSSQSSSTNPVAGQTTELGSDASQPRRDGPKTAGERRSKKNGGTDASRSAPNTEKNAAALDNSAGTPGPTKIMKKTEASVQHVSDSVKDAEADGKQPHQGPSANKQSEKTAKGTQAFLKHVYPSQGVTEPLLQTAMESFGTVSKIEINKNKGFAYVDFNSPDDLQKAIQASPVKIAEGRVDVRERHDRAGPSSGASRGGKSEKGRGGASSGGGRGGRGRGKGGSARGGRSASQAPEAGKASAGDGNVAG